MPGPAGRWGGWIGLLANGVWRGGVGSQVYRAHDTVIGRDVAVKISPVELGLVEGYRERFHREVHTTALGDNIVSPPECLPVAGALQSKVYAGSGWIAAHGQALREPSGQYPHVFDGVVLFPSAQQAAAFFDLSSKSWPVSITNGTISATNVTEGGNGLACQHALTASNNVVIETLFCGYNTTAQAVRIAQRVAAKVPRS